MLAGDKSLIHLVGHEIAHSWTGNLVTNRNFEHFWLNEGFTVFIERKIIGRLLNSKEQDFEAYRGTTELSETINRLGHDNPLTCLVVNLDNVHPDDSFSTVPYEKGQTFLRYLEVLVGGPFVFETFLRTYFDKYRYKSIDTDEFRSFFEAYFVDNQCISLIDWDAWLYKPGMPPVIPKYDDSLMEICITYKNRWVDWEADSEPFPLTKNEVQILSIGQKIQLLQEIIDLPPQPILKLIKFEKIFHFSNMRNSEIKFRWLRIGLKACWEEKVDDALKWLNEIGRMKFVRPLYRDLYNWEEIRQKVIDNFLKHRHTMMHVGAYTVAKDLHINQ